MGRKLRYIPEGGALVEVTCRTLQGRFLLKPTDEIRPIVLGVLARAQRLCSVRLHAFVFLSNHYHLLLSVDNAHQLARFMNYLNSNLAREAGRLNRWQDKFWSRRYQAIVVSEEDAAQISRLRYILSHGCKEGLVARPQDWPGANAVKSLIENVPLEGLWFDRTREYAAKARRESFHQHEYATPEVVRLTSLPCWRHLEETTHRHLVEELVKEIEEETASRHAREGTRPLGVARILAHHPHDRPGKLKKAWAPTFHAATNTVRSELNAAYGWFLQAFREAAERLQHGDLTARFPKGSFPPRFPAAKWEADPAPG